MSVDSVKVRAVGAAVFKYRDYAIKRQCLIIQDELTDGEYHGSEIKFVFMNDWGNIVKVVGNYNDSKITIAVSGEFVYKI